MRVRRARFAGPSSGRRSRPPSHASSSPSSCLRVSSCLRGSVSRRRARSTTRSARGRCRRRRRREPAARARGRSRRAGCLRARSRGARRDRRPHCRRCPIATRRRRSRRSTRPRTFPPPPATSSSAASRRAPPWRARESSRATRRWPRSAAIVLHRRGHGDEVAADRAAGDVRLQLRWGVRRPAAERDRLEHVGFASAVDHRSVSRRSAASRRRARNSSILMLDVFSPSAAAISSCDEPCA